MEFPKNLLDKIHRIDALAMLIQIPDESVDLVFADPPFNVGKKEYRDKRLNYKAWCESWINECFRILKPTGSFYLKTLSRHLEWKMPIMAKQGVFISLVPWRNTSSGRNNKRRFWNSYEPIMVYGKTSKYKFNTYAQISNSQWIRWGGYSTEFKGQMLDSWDDIPFVYSGSIIHPEAILIPGTKKKVHPCQMPEGISRRAIFFSSDPGDIIFDPFAGSGTTLVSAIMTERRYSGCEIEDKFYTLIQNRLIGAKKEKEFIDRQLLLIPKEQLPLSF